MEQCGTMGKINKQSLKVMIVIKYEETEKFADALIMNDVEVQKVYLDASLKDDNSFYVDEVSLENTIIIVDSVEGAFTVQRNYVNNALFFFFNLGVEEDQVVKEQLDFFVIEVKDGEFKTGDDWVKAAILFKQEVPEGFGSCPYIRA